MKILGFISAKYIYLAVGVTMLNLLSIRSISQNQSLVNYGSNIYIEGDATYNGDQSLYIIGDYVNQTNGVSNGRLESNGGKIFVTQDWINYATNNVFTNFSGNNKDGIVTLGSLTNTQLIAGFFPTHFENLNVYGSRKNLAIDAEVNGQFTLDAEFDLLSNDLTIDNSLPSAISYIGGFIKSETLPGNHGFVHWNIGNSLGLYAVPFGSDKDYPNNDLDLSINVKTQMSNGDFISFATYPSDGFNLPLPTGASNLETEIKQTVDRYWVVRPSNFLNKPDIDLIISFTEYETDDFDNDINHEKLKAIRNNTNIGRWLDMNPVGYESNNRVIANNISGADFYDNWTLYYPPAPIANFLIPDAFTPNGDGVNDKFFPVFHTDYDVVSYDFYIYDRWGSAVFHSKNTLNSWNGKINGKDPVTAVYTWVIIVKGKYNDNIDGEGVKERHVGRVTLYN